MSRMWRDTISPKYNYRSIASRNALQTGPASFS